MNAIVGATDLSSSLSTECTATTDIRFRRKGSLADGYLGLTVCTDYNRPTSRCESADAYQSLDAQHEAMDDPNNDVPFSNGTESDGELVRNFRATWCHEAGHSVGLVHHPAKVADREDYYDGSAPDREQDCMVMGHLELDRQWMRLNSHHRAHLNTAY